MEEENGSDYNDNSDVGCLFWINVLFNDQTTEEKRRRIKTITRYFLNISLFLNKK